MKIYKSAPVHAVKSLIREWHHSVFEEFSLVKKKKMHTLPVQLGCSSSHHSLHAFLTLNLLENPVATQKLQDCNGIVRQIARGTPPPNTQKRKSNIQRKKVHNAAAHVTESKTSGQPDVF